MKKEKGITLIALVITIIVLLILAGVALKLVTGGDGILGKAEKSVEETLIQQGKEKIELAIMDLIIEKSPKGEELKSKDILLIANDEISVVESEEFPVIVIYKEKYNYKVEKVNGNLVVKNVSEIDEPTQPDKPIESDDKIISKSFVPKIKEITDSGFTIVVDEKYVGDDSGNKNEINKYEYYVGNTKYESTESEYTITNLDNLNVPIYVIVYDNANNSRISKIVEITDYVVKGRAFANNNESDAYRAFDKNSGSSWDGGNVDSYIGYEFEEPVECTKVKISQPYYLDVIKEFKIEYSDDNINYYNASDGTFTFPKVQYEVQTFELKPNLGKHKYWRYQNLSNYREGPYCAITELEFCSFEKITRVQLTKQMTSNNSSEGKVFTNNNEENAYLAFDKDLNSYWDGRNIDSYIGYEFEEPVECTSVSIKQPYNSSVIKDFKIQYSDDNINYNDAGETFNFKKSKDIQTFKLNPNLGKHKYWRYQNLNNYTDEAYCAISELEFYQVIRLLITKGSL